MQDRPQLAGGERGNSLHSRPVHHEVPDHYAALGLHRRCTEAQIRTAYRVLAKQLHPDVNGGSADAVERTQALNAACETLSDPERRREYDHELTTADKVASPARSGRIERNVSQEVHLRFEEFLRGTTLEIRLNDPANPHGAETYEFVVPPETAPGARFRIPREEPFRGGFVLVKVKARPNFRFKPRGSDLRCDLRISTQLAQQGGSEMVRGLTGSVRVTIPRGVGRGEIIRIPGEGLPKPRGGRGDLLVRITYRPEMRIKRAASR
jgi:DnaJ-class molecular chaperone